MALASLCSKVKSFEMPSVTAFIVDHHIRPGSTEEAESVARNLKDMGECAKKPHNAQFLNCLCPGIQSQVLSLDWQGKHPGKSRSLESEARTLRFQALGRACAQAHISDLLLAHHSDDQAETVLSRICAGYLGIGLYGIQASAPIPECHGIFQVSESGQGRVMYDSRTSRRFLVARGGVVVHRPLLDFTKAELIAICKEHQVKWHEDATNADKTLTIRNTIRHVLQTDALPSALNSESLRNLAASKGRHYQSCAHAAQAMFDDCRVQLDMRTGYVTFMFKPEIQNRLASEPNPHFVAALLMRKLLSLSEDRENLPLQELWRSVKYTFPYLFGDEQIKDTSINIGDVTLGKDMIISGSPEGASLEDWGTSRTSPHCHTRYKVFPRPVAKPEKYTQTYSSAEVPIHNALQKPRGERTKLFQGRWWIRLSLDNTKVPAGTSFFVRFFNREDLVEIRRTDAGLPSLEVLEKIFKSGLPQQCRFTIPAIAVRYQAKGKDGSMQTTETLYALPTLGWQRSGFNHGDGETFEAGSCRYSVFYKSIDFVLSDNHTITSGGQVGSSRRHARPVRSAYRQTRH
jgi:tRNA(Ile)-lysidine synthase